MSQYKINRSLPNSVGSTALKTPKGGLQLNLSPTQPSPAPPMTQMSIISKASPRMPAWDGPYKLMVKILNASLKGIPEPEGLKIYPIVEFQRSGSAQVRKIQGSCASKATEVSFKQGGSEIEAEWNWPLDIYYGGEVIHTNTAGNDSLKIYLYHGQVLFGDTGAFPLRYLIDGSKKATPRMNLTNNGVLMGTVHIEIQQIKRNQPANKQLFEPGVLKIVLKEALLLNSNESAPGNLVAKVHLQDSKQYKSKLSRTFMWKELAPKVMHVWNEEYDFPITQKQLVQNTIRVTLISEDKRGPVEVGSEEFCFPLFFYNGHGIKDHFYVFKNELAVGKILLHTSFEPYPPEQMVREPTPPLVPKDSLLMDDTSSIRKKRKIKKKRLPSKPKPKPDWNNRFWVDGIQNFDRTHPYYKVYFDSPNYRGSVEHSQGRESYNGSHSRFLKEHSKSQSKSPRMQRDSTLGDNFINRSIEESVKGLGRLDTLNQLNQNAQKNLLKQSTELPKQTTVKKEGHPSANIQLNQPSIDQQHEYHQFIQTIQPVQTENRKRMKQPGFSTMGNETVSNMSFGNQSRKTQNAKRNSASQNRFSYNHLLSQPRNVTLSSSRGSASYRSGSRRRNLSPTLQALQYGNPLLSKHHTPYLSPKMVQQFAAPINALARQFQWVRSPRTGKFVTHTRIQQLEKRQLPGAQNPEEANQLPTIHHKKHKRSPNQRFSQMQPGKIKQAIKSVTNRSPASTFQGVVQQQPTPMTMAPPTTFSEASRLDHSMESPLPQYYNQYYVLTPPNQQSRIKTQGRMSRKFINNTTAAATDEQSDQVVLSQGYQKNMRRRLRAQQAVNESQVMGGSTQQGFNRRGFNEWANGGQVKTMTSYGGNFSNNFYDSYQQYF